GADAGGSQLHALVRLGCPPTSLLPPGDCSPWCPFYDPSPFPCAHLLDHLIRLEEERRGDGEAERLGGLEVDDELELHRLLHGQVRRLGTVQNLVHVGGGAAEEVPKVWPIGHEPANFHTLPPEVHHWPLRSEERRVGKEWRARCAACSQRE